jgi:hypothetical protein
MSKSCSKPAISRGVEDRQYLHAVRLNPMDNNIRQPRHSQNTRSKMSFGPTRKWQDSKSLDCILNALHRPRSRLRIMPGYVIVNSLKMT